MVGGVRQKIMNRKSSFGDCFEMAKSLYFPNGKSSKGSLFSFQVKLMAIDLSEVLDETSCGNNYFIETYVEKFGLKVAKFAFTSKIKSYMDIIDVPESDDDDELFQIPPLLTKRKEAPAMDLSNVS